MRYPAYEEYKDSRIEWIGEVPEHWQIKKGKYLGKILTSPSLTDDVLSEEGDIHYIKVSDLNNVDESLILHKTKLYANSKASKSSSSFNFICFPKRGAAIFTNKACFVPGRAFLDPNLMGWEIYSRVNPIYVIHVLLTRKLDDLADVSTVPQINNKHIDPETFPCPPKEEQDSIVSFLDRETAKIDTLIAKQEELIRLLGEKRQAVISTAVTKGLNPHAPLKDSGIEWLGQIPAHWEVTRAKFVSSIFIPQRNKPELNDTDGTPWATMEDMKSDFIESTKYRVRFADAQKAGSKTLVRGSVIASCVGNFGVASINKMDVIINQQLQAFIPHSIQGEYLREIVSISSSYFNLIGTAATLIYVNQQGFANMPVLVPPKNEQEAICGYVTKQKKKFDELIQKANQAVELLKERRTALISAAVTGKIDVRNTKALKGKVN